MLPLLLLDDVDREARIAQLCRRERATSREVMARAQAIVDEVRAGGDAALLAITARIEGRTLERVELPRAEWERTADETTLEVRGAIERAHARIRRFADEEARHLVGCGFLLEEGGDGGSEVSGGGSEVGGGGGRVASAVGERTRLELRVRPLLRVGVYAPGGTARYPSSVLMAVAAARAAGVREVLLCTPGPSAEVLHAARVAGVDRVFAVGGAQAVAAMAYGTESVPRVDKIVGPGNAYVAAAKRLVFGDVAIDQIAGPSEILIVADADADARWVAADLLSQAEHDSDAAAILITPSRALGERVVVEVERQLALLPRRQIAATAIEGSCAAIVTRDLEEALALCDRYAPEHLELMVADARAVAGRVQNAGAIFVGAHTPEAVGDYFAGPNHVLPTAGAARFGSPLGVHDFLKRTSVLEYTPSLLRAHAPDIRRLADVEGLEAHARAVELRLAREPA